MHSLKRLYKDFSQELNDFENILDELSTDTKSKKRDIFLEGTFFKVIILWENFLEEVFLKAMCSCKTNSDKVLKPKIAISRNIDQAFKKISMQRQNRENSYIDWLDHTKLRERTENIFHHKSRLHRTYANSQRLKEIQTLRNHLAHSSKKTEKKFLELIIQIQGYLFVPNPNVADFLLLTNRRLAKNFYKVYIEYYRTLADELCR